MDFHFGTMLFQLLTLLLLLLLLVCLVAVPLLIFHKMKSQKRGDDADPSQKKGSKPTE